MPCGIDVLAPRPRSREAQRMIDHAARDFVVASETGEDRQTCRIRRRPAGRAQRVRAQIPDRAGTRDPAGALRIERIQLVELARILAARPPSMCTDVGIGYGPLSDSPAYVNAGRNRFVCFDTTSYGIPIGWPSYSPEPKSGWSPVSSPIDWIICAEFAATGSASTRSFHAFVAGKIVHLGAPGKRSACADAPPRSSAPAATKNSRLMPTGG